MNSDRGLQPERTALAWRRTALSVLVGSAAGARLLAPQLGSVAVATGLLGAAFGVWLYVGAGTRAGRGREVLAVTALFAGLLGVSGLVLVLVHACVVS